MPFNRQRDDRLKVLCIDGNSHDRNLVVDVLEAQKPGFAVTCATTREEAEALLRDGRWQAVLADFDILGPDTPGVVVSITAATPGVPVIIVTDTDSEEAAVASMRRGASDYVLKTPAYLRRLPATVRCAVENAERRRSLEQIQEMLERTEQIAHVGSWEWDVATDEVRWSCELYRIVGWDPSVPPPPLAEQSSLFAPGEYGRIVGAMEKAVSRGTPYMMEVDLVRENGEVRCCVVTGIASRNANGETTHLYGSLQDVTEIREMEHALRDHERQYRALVDNTRDIIWVADLDLNFTYASPSVERVLGYAPQEFVGTNVAEHCDGNTMAKLQTVLESQLALAPEEAGVVLDIPVRHRNGSQVLLEVSAAVVFGDNGNPLYIQGSSRDVSERVRMEAERERLMQAIRHAGEAIVITDADGIIEYVNPEFERITGYTAAEAIGRKPGFLSNGEENSAVYDGLWAAITGGLTWEGRFVNRRKDGMPFIEAATISPVCDPAGRITNYVAVKRDITGALELEAQLQQSRKIEAIGRLAGGVAHDFNNMLGVILGYARQAQGRLEPNSPVHKDLREIVRAGERSAELTRQLLGFARRQAVSPRVIDLNASVENTLGMLRRMVREDVDLQWRPGNDALPVEIDPSQMDQILTNLVVNARDAITGVGRIIIETGVVEFDEEYCTQHVGFSPGRFSRLTVSDDGRGMDRRTLSHIFEPFFTTKGASEGTGLGLATIYGIVKQNNGFINVYSEPNLGTTINIYLAIHSAGEIDPARPKNVVTRMGTETVLLVEDEAALLELATLSLQNLGYRVLPAHRPSRAVELAGQHAGSIDLLMTDVVMPEMSGAELWAKLRPANPGMRCLFVSGYPADVAREHGRLESGVNFLQKPFVADALAEKLREVLDN